MTGTEAENILRELIENLSLLPDKNTVVLVEDREDEAFWRRILETFAPEINPHFPFFSSSGKSGLRGFADYVSPQVLLCVDSDNDAFHETANTSWLSPRRQFIYQTYAYSRENHLIHPENLIRECMELTFETHDFKSDFEEISKTLHNFLMLWLFLTDLDERGKIVKGHGVKFSWADLKTVIQDCFEKADFINARTLDDVRNILTEFKVEFAEYLEQTEGLFIENGLEEWWKEFQVFKQKCQIQASETLWFIRGHEAFDDIIVPYFDKIVQTLSKNLANKAKSKEDKNHWQNIAKPGTTYRDRLSISYRTCLMTSQKCRFFEEIKRDFQMDFSKD